MGKFWMVIKRTGCGSDRTTYRHLTYEFALEEAERLTRKTNGDDFVILEARDVVRIDKMPVICLPIEDA